MSIEKHYLITTEFRIGEIVESITRVCKSAMRPESCQAEVAQGMNCGSFDKDMYSRPCFDIDGFITYPSSIKEIDESTFELLMSHIEFYPLEQKESELSQDVKEYLEATV